MLSDILIYILPLGALLGRISIIIKFRSLMREVLTEEENDRDTHRTHLVALAGFSFAGILGVAVADTALRENLRVPAYYLLISFLYYFIALNMQGYKFSRWHDQLGDAFLEGGNFTLILSIMAIISITESDLWRQGIMFTLLLAVWVTDTLIRILISNRYLYERDQ